jgi:osmotically-inducible protein OsmY
MNKPNNVLAADVVDELSWDPQLDDSAIAVSAHDGRVTLTGVVPTYREVGLAIDDTGSVAGVKTIDNELVVSFTGDPVTDEELAVECANAIAGSMQVPQGSVSADVLNGYVTLKGKVRHHYQRRAADDAVALVGGVLGVDDKIAISSDPIPSDIADRINKALRRNALVDDAQITVSNVGATIYLDGTSDSWTARDEADATAWNAPGVTDVVDRIEIV